MGLVKCESLSGEGTISSPKYYAGLDDKRGEQCRRYFVYGTQNELVSGTTTSVRFTIDAPVKVVWSQFIDFNAWQSGFHHVYSGVIGGLEGKTFWLTIGANSTEYRVVRVIAPHLIVLSQIVLSEGSMAGMGGFMVFMLNEHQDGTVLSIFMQHDRATVGLGDEEAIEYWQRSAQDNLIKWGEHFIPTLRSLSRSACKLNGGE